MSRTGQEKEADGGRAGPRAANAARAGLVIVTAAGLVSGFSLVLEILAAGILALTAVVVTVAVLARDGHAGRSRPERALLLIGMLLDRTRSPTTPVRRADS